MTITKTFFGGIPTDLEVRRLRDEYPQDILKPGFKMFYEDVCSLINSEYRTSRFNAVTNRWRKSVERDHGIVIGTEPGTAFIVLDDHEKADLSTLKLMSSVRAAKRSYVVASHVDVKNLSEEDRKQLDHNVARSVSIMQAVRLKSKAALPDI